MWGGRNKASKFVSEEYASGLRASSLPSFLPFFLEKAREGLPTETDRRNEEKEKAFFFCFCFCFLRTYIVPRLIVFIPRISQAYDEPQVIDGSGELTLGSGVRLHGPRYPSS